ncbi:hypothetical protein [Nocardia tengchongensis]|uniref:hypothetical protein n=1 Tax=Nocardia tengchongensis TaxID=2055889 RepID=UPI003647DF61
MPEILDTHVLCRTCSALIPDDPLLDFPAAECRDCDERPFCQDCEERVDDVHWTVDHGVLCTTCARRWSQCEYCERYTTAGEATVSGDIVCDTCHIDHYWRCSDCRLLSRYLRSVDTGEEVCRDCESQYRVCDDCDYLTANDDYCTSCSRDRRDDHIHDYSYKPAPYFHGQGPVFLGLELEIKTRSSSLQACAEIAADHLGDLGYLKEDGSIGYNAGFEIVTHPMSYEWAIDEFPWKMLRELRIRGAYVDDNVGIHVHVSRKGFDSAAHVYRWMKFHVAMLRGAFGHYRASHRAVTLFDQLKRDRDFSRIWTSSIRVAYARQPNELAHLRDPETGDPYSVSIDIAEVSDTRDIRVCYAYRESHADPL